MSELLPGGVQRVSVHGLGKLGAVVAGTLASRGLAVVGVDVVASVVEQVAAAKAPVSEPGLQELYDRSGGRLSATTDVHRAVQDSDASLLLVPTPSNGDGGYSLEFALAACREIGAALREKDEYHLVAMKSTVLPGACDRKLIPELERASGKRCGPDFGFAYNPEFIALGSVVHDLTHPDLVLVGSVDATAANLIEDLHARVLDRDPPTAHMNVVNAELTKLAVNTYVTMKISYANSIARICEQLPGGDADVVTAALGRDTRIGPRYLKGGLGFGGPCFPRDNRALLQCSRELGVPFPLAESTDATNLDPARGVVERALEEAGERRRVAVLGLSYKPGTSVVERSQGVFIAQQLCERGAAVTVYDPEAVGTAAAELPGGVRFAESAKAALVDQDVVIVATPWPEFAALDYGSEARVIDCWGVLTEAQAFGRVRLGVGPEPLRG